MTASSYDQYISVTDPFGVSFSNRYMNWRRKHAILSLLHHILSARPGPTRLIEIGCGDGSLLFDCRDAFKHMPDITFTGIDIGPSGIAAAQRRIALEGQTNISFAVCDAHHLPFADGTFDIVLSTEVIEHITDPAPLLREIHRVMANGGHAIITTPNGGNQLILCAGTFLRIISLGMLTRGHRKVRAIAAAASNEGRRERDIGHGHVSVHSAGAWKKIFHAAGFRICAAHGTGGMVFGDPSVDQHRILFALMVLADTFLAHLPWTSLWSEILLFHLRKEVNRP